jgi:ankyrin repeat protein
MQEEVEEEPDLLLFEDEDGDGTPLYSACCSRTSSLEKVRWLLDHGASFNEADDEITSALSNASTAGNTSVVKLLLEMGANPKNFGWVRNKECKQLLKVSCSLTFKLACPSIRY